MIVGDCVEAMAAMEEASVDAVVTDPPYGLGFMGKDWDSPGRSFVERKAVRSNTFDHVGGNHNPTSPQDAARTARVEGQRAQAWHERWAREAFRVLKPGGYLLAFSGTRTSHRMVCAVEDAGFEIRDSVCWLYGSGFPKSLDVSKAIDKAAGAEREVVGTKLGRPGYSLAEGSDNEIFGKGWGGSGDPQREAEISAPATEEARRWTGWGTALKPAHEPICVARKPLAERTVAGQVLATGTGALNIDACRIEGKWTTWRRSDGTINPSAGFADDYVGGSERPEDVRNPEHPAGRWPANVVLDEAAAAMLDAQSGTLKSGKLEPHHYRGQPRFQNTYGACNGSVRATEGTFGGDSGGASRFFYTAKASRSEREAGLLGKIPCGHCGGLDTLDHPAPTEKEPDRRAKCIRCVHPTVKPVELTRWLVKLVCPLGGTILDPFAGSGTTGIACALEHFGFVGIERDPEYAAIAEARIAHWREQATPPPQLQLSASLP